MRTVQLRASPFLCYFVQSSVKREDRWKQIFLTFLWAQNTSKVLSKVMSLQWAGHYAGRRTLTQAAHDSSIAGGHPAWCMHRLHYKSTISMWEFPVPVSGLHVNWELGSLLGAYVIGVQMYKRFSRQSHSVKLRMWNAILHFSDNTDHQFVQNISKGLCVCNRRIFAAFILRKSVSQWLWFATIMTDSIIGQQVFPIFPATSMGRIYILSCPSSVGFSHVA